MTSGTLVHRCRFVEWTPSAINCMEISPVGCHPVLAVARSSGDLELYDVCQNWHQRRIPCGGAVGRAIESLVWIPPTAVSAASKNLTATGGVGNWGPDIGSVIPLTDSPMARLFSAGHDGNVIEWDLQGLRPKRHLNSTGGGIWCMTRSPCGAFLAIACEDGQIRIVKVSSFQICKTLPFYQGKFLSIAWNNGIIAAGTAESAILAYDVSNLGEKSAPPRLLHKLALEAQKGPVFVWSVKFAGKVLVAGTSTGSVQLWNPQLGTMMKEYRLCRVDVLTLTVQNNLKKMYASTADGRTFELGHGSKHPFWSPTGNFSNHTHDIRASACALIPYLGDNKNIRWADVIITGGVDAQISIYSPTSIQDQCRKLTSFPARQSQFSTASDARILAASMGSFINLWALGNLDQYVFDITNDELITETDEIMDEEKINLNKKRAKKFILNSGTFRLAKDGRNLLKINIPNDESVSYIDISRDGRFAAYCTRSSLRLFQIHLKKGEEEEFADIDLTKLALPNGDYGVAQVIKFSPDSKSLAVIYSDDKQGGRLVIYVISSSSVSVLNEIKMSTKVAFDMISWEGEFIAVHDILGNIYILNSTEKQIVETLSNTVPVDVMRIVEGGILFYVTADEHIHWYELREKKQHSINDLPPHWRNHSKTLLGVSAKDPKNIRVYSDSAIFEINLDAAFPTHADYTRLHKAALKANIKSNEMYTNSKLSNLQAPFRKNLLIHRQEGVMFLDYMGNREAVLVQRSADDIMAALPPAQQRKKFGAA